MKKRLFCMFLLFAAVLTGLTFRITWQDRESTREAQTAAILLTNDMEQQLAQGMPRLPERLLHSCGRNWCVWSLPLRITARRGCCGALPFAPWQPPSGICTLQCCVPLTS